MKLDFARLLVAFVALTAGAAFADVARTTSGPVEGDGADGVLIFKGIPYAAAPIGDLRWRAPQPPAAWNTPRQATAFGPRCLQPQRRDRPGEAGPTSEDCLYLNVWTPSLTGQRPVMVWIHGGAFRIGSGSMAVYDGTRFAQGGVVLVTLNYRLGRFGFFAHPALAAANPEDARGNYGLMDQVAALEWVKRNIAAFGGDPTNVTVFGESAGGSSVLHLLTSPKANRLFQKAIVESGGGHQIDRRLDSARGTREALTQQGVEWANGLGIASDAAALRSVPADRVLGDGQLSAGLNEVGPVIDGEWVLADPGERFAHGDFVKVPLLIGSNSYEASVLAAFGSSATRLLDGLGEQAAGLRALYAGVAKDDTQLADQAFGDSAFGSGARFVARSVAAQAQPAYLYHFDYVAEKRRGRVPGAGHGSEIPYVFDSTDKLPSIVQMFVTPEDVAMADTLNRYWINFAKTGDPNGSGLPHWPRYGADSDELLLIRPKIEAVAHFRAPQLDFFQQRWEGAEAH